MKAKDDIPKLGDTETSKRISNLISQINHPNWQNFSDEKKLELLSSTVILIHRLLWMLGLYRKTKVGTSEQKRSGPKKKFIKIFGLEIKRREVEIEERRFSA